MLKNFINFLFICFVLVGCKEKKNIPAVSSFDAESLSGSWYELAYVNNKSHNSCSEVIYEYETGIKNPLNIIIKCKKKSDGRVVSKSGFMKFATKNENAGWFKVSFKRPFYHDYKIIHIGEKNGKISYILALTSGDNSISILSKESKLDYKKMVLMIEKIESLGFSSENIMYLNQK